MLNWKFNTGQSETTKVHTVHKGDDVMNSKLSRPAVKKRPFAVLLTPSLPPVNVVVEALENQPPSRSADHQEEENNAANCSDCSNDSFEALLASSSPSKFVAPSRKQAKFAAGGVSRSCLPHELPSYRLVVVSVEKCGEGNSLRLGVKRADSSGGGADVDNVKTLILSGFWVQTPLKVGQVILLHGNFGSSEGEEGKCFVLSDEENFLVTQPDFLVPCTAVVGGVFCRRKTILSHLFRGGVDSGNLAMLVGTCVHELFQLAVSTPEKCSEQWLSEQFNKLVSDVRTLEELSALSCSPGALGQLVTPYFRNVARWVRRFLVLGHKFDGGDQGERLAVSRVRDIEESIWAPKLGIRGKIDATLVLRNEKGGTLLSPLELKTGRDHGGADHVGQLMLYSLMLRSIDSSSSVWDNSLLFYLKSSESARPVKSTNAAAIRGLFQLRNEIAHYMNRSADEFDLPAPIRNERFCATCPFLIGCSLWSKCFATPNTMGDDDDMYRSALSHLSGGQIDYFGAAMRFLQRELVAAGASKSKLSDVWNVDAKERESRGEALCDMKIGDVRKLSSERVMMTMAKIGRSKFATCTFAAGDIVVVSNDTRKHYGVFLASVISVSSAGLMDFLHPSPVPNSVFLDDSVSLLVDKLLRDDYRNDVFRLDRYESGVSYNLAMTNVLRLMDNSVARQRLRQLIVDGCSPKIEEKCSDQILSLVKPIVKQEKMNGAQVRSLLKAILARDYLLVRGLPGSGKSTTFAIMIRCLLMLGKTVLLTAYTHSAVDNVLKKLIELHEQVDKEQILRLGSVHQVSKDCRQFCLDSKMKRPSVGDNHGDPQATIDFLNNIYDSSAVVACTCLQAASHSLFSRRKFDYAIVDEATLATEPVCIGPLHCAEKFVLIGDPLQLEPLVLDRQNKASSQAGSLFSRLESVAETSGAVVTLTKQYRMNSEISRLSSELFYRNQLVCANETVARQTLKLNIAPPGEAAECLSRPATSGHFCHSALFLDTSRLAKQNALFLAKSTGAGLLANAGEADLIANICGEFLSLGVRAADIGVVCIYRHQVKAVRDVLRGAISSVIEVNTADVFQGRDKSVILVSFTWTATDQTGQFDENKSSRLLSDGRRLNVAMTRAKRKLIMIGHMDSLTRFSHIDTLVTRILRQEQIVTL